MKRISFIISALVTLAIAGCEKESSLPIRFSPAESGARFKFLHMSPDAPSVLLYANDVKVTAVAANSSGQEQGVVFGGLFPANIGYAVIPSGPSVKVEVKVPASSPTLPGVVAITTNLKIDEGKFYTIAAVDSLPKLSAVIIEDDTTVPDPSKAYFRIANFMNNSGARIEVHNTTYTPSNTTRPTTLKYTISNLEFKSVAAYDTITPGQVYRYVLKNPANDSRLDSVTISSIAPGRKYTLYVRGVMGQTGSTNTKRPLIFQYANL